MAACVKEVRVRACVGTERKMKEEERQKKKKKKKRKGFMLSARISPMETTSDSNPELVHGFRRESNLGTHSRASCLREPL